MLHCRRKKYSWSYPQRPPWGKKEGPLQRGLIKSQSMDCPQKSDRCREGAIVDIWLYKMGCVAIV